MSEPTDPNVPYLDKPYVFEQTEQAAEEGWYGYEPAGKDETEAHTVAGVIKAEEDAKKAREEKQRKALGKRGLEPQPKPTAREKWGETPMAQAPKSQGRRSRQPASAE